MANIHEAVKRLTKNETVTHLGWKDDEYLFMVSNQITEIDNNPFNIAKVIYISKDGNAQPWQPTVNQLLSDDWLLKTNKNKIKQVPKEGEIWKYIGKISNPKDDFVRIFSVEFIDNTDGEKEVWYDWFTPAGRDFANRTMQDFQNDFEFCSDKLNNIFKDLCKGEINEKYLNEL